MDADVCTDLVPEQGKRKQGGKDLLLLMSKNMFVCFFLFVFFGGRGGFGQLGFASPVLQSQIQQWIPPQGGRTICWSPN